MVRSLQHYIRKSNDFAVNYPNVESFTNVNFGRKAQSSGLYKCINGKTVPQQILQGIQKFHWLMHYYRLEAIRDYFKNLPCLKSQYLEVLILFTLGSDKSQHLSNKIVQHMKASRTQAS